MFIGGPYITLNITHVTLKKAQICGPIYHNVAHGRKIVASNTCGADEAENYYVQMGEPTGIR